MCYSAEASLFTFTIGTVFSLLLAHRGGDDAIVGWFFAFVALMQGIEYLLWRNQLCTAENAALSKVAMAFNHAQPLVLGAIIIALGRPAARTTVSLLMIAYAIAAAAFSNQYLATSVLHCTKKEEGDPHLLWQWNSLQGGTAFYGLFLAVLVLSSAIGFRSRAYGIAAGLFGGGLFATSAAIYTRQYMGAMWCFYTAFAPLAIWAWRR